MGFSLPSLFKNNVYIISFSISVSLYWAVTFGYLRSLYYQKSSFLTINVGKVIYLIVNNLIVLIVFLELNEIKYIKHLA